MNFYTLTMMITVIILIGLLTWIGITMTSAKKQQVFPSIQNLCPDGWTSDNLGYCTQPLNTLSPNRLPAGNTGNTISDILNYTGGICGAKQWASKNSINWDGVTNYNGQCN